MIIGRGMKTFAVAAVSMHDQNCGHRLSATLDHAITGKKTVFRLAQKLWKTITKQDNVRTNTESVQCHHVFRYSLLGAQAYRSQDLHLRGHVTSSVM